MKTCWAQYLLWLVVAILGVGGMLSACGQKGALYRPAPQVENTPELVVPAADNAEKARK
ncbi:MAG TPA: hypothetical protein ENK51_10165 [Gammaproteobacteria bacterium]|nr:hypothetical protein [Gammaproteobacteria bacterium]